MLLFAGAEPIFDCFRADPRFQQILRRMKLTPDSKWSKPEHADARPGSLA